MAADDRAGHSLPWEARREVNEYVEQLSDELAGRGHRVLVLAPSSSRTLVRESRRLIRAAAGNPDALFRTGEARVIAVGQSVPVPPARRGGSVSLPLDGARTIERAARERSARHPARARAVCAECVRGRAAALARAQRRHLPLAHRARALDAGRTALHRALLRRLDARTATFDVTREPRVELLSRRVRGDRAGVDLERYAPGGRRGDRSRSRSRPRRSAQPCGSSCGRCELPAELDWRATSGRHARRSRCRGRPRAARARPASRRARRGLESCSGARTFLRRRRRGLAPAPSRS